MIFALGREPGGARPRDAHDSQGCPTRLSTEGNKARGALARGAHVVRSFEKRAERLLEFLVIAEASRDFLGDKYGALRPATQSPAVRLNGALEPPRAQLRNLVSA